MYQEESIIESIIKSSIIATVMFFIYVVTFYYKDRFAANFTTLTKKQNIESCFSVKKMLAIFIFAIFITFGIMLNISDILFRYIFLISTIVLVATTAHILYMDKRITFASALVMAVVPFIIWNPVLGVITTLIIVSGAILFTLNVLSWRVIKLFFIVFVLFDIIAVFGTGYMITFAEKAISNGVPSILVIPAGFMSLSTGMVLGAGDVFLFGLLAFGYSKVSKKSKDMEAMFIFIGIMVFSVLLFISNLMFPSIAFPATVYVAIAFSLAYQICKKEAKKS